MGERLGGPSSHDSEVGKLTEFDLHDLEDSTLRLGVKTRSGKHYVLRRDPAGSTTIFAYRRELEAEDQIKGVIITITGTPKIIRLGETLRIIQDANGDTMTGAITSPIVEMRLLSTTD